MADRQRARRVKERIQQTVAGLLARRIKDPRLELVTITDVRVTGDLQHASIFYTVFGDEEAREGARRAFESAKGMIRSEVGRALGIRLTPSLEFIPDALPETTASLEETLAATKAHDEEIAALAKNASYAGDENPYRSEDEEDGYEGGEGDVSDEEHDSSDTQIPRADDDSDIDDPAEADNDTDTTSPVANR